MNELPKKITADDISDAYDDTYRSTLGRLHWTTNTAIQLKAALLHRYNAHDDNQKKIDDLLTACRIAAELCEKLGSIKSEVISDTCPPYYNLEVYSDLSKRIFTDNALLIRKIIAQAEKQ